MTRVTLAVPIDVARLFDSTVSTAQIDADTFQTSPDDDDLLTSMIEDAEEEFFSQTGESLRIGSVGLPGQRETYEQPTYKLSGHKLMKGTFTGVWSEYLPEQKTITLENQRLLPFDADAGDEVYIYRGLDDGIGTGWEDVTDERGTMWDILDYREGRFTFSPIETAEYLMDYHVGAVSGTVPSFLRRMRFAVRYRYGGLGGSRSRPAETELGVAIDDSQTDTVAVTDGTTFPSSEEIVVLVDREYMSVRPDPGNDELTILERGVRGTTAASHDADALVTYTPPSIRKAVASRAGMQLLSAGRYSDWAPDTEDDISKDDLLDEFEATWQMTVDALS